VIKYLNQNWVIGLFDLCNGLFFSISVLTTTYFVENKLARKIRPNLNDDRLIKINDYSLPFVSFYWVCSRNNWACS